MSELNTITAEQIIQELEEETFIELTTEDDLLIISFRKFFGTEKEFLFVLNAKAVGSCKTKKTALKKIEGFLQKGFEIEQ